MSLKLSIEKLMHGENLDSELCYAAINELLDPNKNPLQAAAFLVLLRSKSETPQELVAIVNCLRQKMIKVPTQHRVLDIVGTGGDGQNTVNISTGSAILAASCGIKVAKHGNRAASSLAGSADVLEALGVNIQLTPEKVAESIDKIGIGFCYSPNFHPVTKELKLLRKQLNVPTSFNLLGPLLNPANAQHLLLGVMDNNLLSKMATVLQQLYCSRSMLVHGQGLDEISCVGPAQIVELNADEMKTSILDPATYGFAYCNISDLRGGDAKHNANLLRLGLAGKHDAITNTLILNAAAALNIYHEKMTLQEAISFARERLFNGAALQLLNSWIEYSHEST